MGGGERVMSCVERSERDAQLLGVSLEEKDGIIEALGLWARRRIPSISRSATAVVRTSRRAMLRLAKSFLSSSSVIFLS
jgi:hypothetical protein